MKCAKCKSSKLKAHNFNNLDYILYYKNKWIMSDPSKKSLFYSSKQKYSIRCLDCNNIWEDDITKAYSPKIDQTEIILDIDHTLAHATEDYYFDNPKTDLKFKNPEINFDYFFSFTKRPYLEDFLTYCCNRFDKINFYSSAQPWHVKAFLSMIKIPDNKIGFIKDIRFTSNERSLAFHREYMKEMNNSFMVDDKPLVIKGYNNVVFPIEKFNAYEYPSKDKGLLRLIDFIENKKEEEINLPLEMDGSIELFLKKLTIDVKKITFEILQKITKEINHISEEDLKSYSVITNIYENYFTIKDDKVNLSIVDLNYSEYKKLIKLIKPFLKSKILSKKEFNDMIKTL